MKVGEAMSEWLLRRCAEYCSCHGCLQGRLAGGNGGGNGGGGGGGSAGDEHIISEHCSLQERTLMFMELG